MKLFGDFLRDFPVMCASASDIPGVTVLAAKSADGARKAVLVTDYRSGLRKLAIDVKGVAPDTECEVAIHDFERNLETVKTKLDGGRLVLPKRDANSCAFVVVF